LYSGGEGEEGSCKEKDDNSLSCDDIKRSSQCPLSSVDNLKEKKCIWILNKCYDVKNTCESITDEEICEAEGSAIETNGNTLNCLWLKENETKNINGRCVNEVCLTLLLNSIIEFFFFFFFGFLFFFYF
jgi:hypothetical protein